VRYFLDTEFNGFGGDLISLALAPEQAEAPIFYEALECATPDPWVVTHVLPVLGILPISRQTMAIKLAAYLRDDSEPVAVADWPEDIAHLAMLLVTGPGFRTPTPKFVFELLDLPLFHSEGLSDLPHNAQSDARALRTYILSEERWPGASNPSK
jgi:hypothetical protein